MSAVPFNTATPARPAELHQRRIRLARQPVAAGQAREHVRAALRAWQVPVDPDVAILLTSDAVTNAITHGAGPSITVAIRCTRGHLRVDVYDSARSLPADTTGRASDGLDGRDGRDGKQVQPGLALVVLLADDWGVFRTPVGRAVYFALALQRVPG